MPAPPAITNAPVSLLVEDVVLYVLIISSVTTTLVVTVVSCIVNFSAKISPATCKSWPIFTVPAIPTPPLTTNAPVVLEIDVAVFVIVVRPVTYRFPLRYD